MPLRKPSLVSLAPLRAHLETHPLSAYDLTHDTLPVALNRLIPGTVHLAPIINCFDDASCAFDSVLVCVEDPDQVGATYSFVLREDNPRIDRLDLDTYRPSRGRFINMLLRVTNKKTTGATNRLEFALGRADQMRRVLGPAPEHVHANIGDYGNTMWRYHQAHSLLTPEEVEEFWFSIALGADTTTVRALRDTLTAAQAVRDNHQRADLPTLAVNLIREHVHAYNGVTLNAWQIEHLRLGAPLLATPFEAWEDEVGRLVAQAYTTQALRGVELERLATRDTGNRTVGPQAARFPIAG
jgi:hypothetical protein